MSSPEQKPAIVSLKGVSSSMNSCHKLNVNHFDRYEKQETKIVDQIIHIKILDQEVAEKNVSLEQEIAKLEANVDKL